MFGSWLPAILGILVFGTMLVALLSARAGVHRRLDDPSRRDSPRDMADRGHDQGRAT